VGVATSSGTVLQRDLAGNILYRVLLCAGKGIALLEINVEKIKVEVEVLTAVVMK
jgi:hypothetical protein